MKKFLYYFNVDDHDQIHPQSDLNEYMEALKYYQNQIIEFVGDSTTSLIAINEAADLFDRKADLNYEWKFTTDNTIKPRVILAKLSLT